MEAGCTACGEERQVSEKDRAKASILLSGLLQQAGRPAEAIEVLEQAAKEHPGDAEVGHRLAIMYARAGRYREAAVECERLVALDGRNIVALDTLAALYVRVGEREKAWPVVRQLLGLCPEEPRYRLLKATMLQEAGDTPGAMDEYLAVLDRDEEGSATEAAEEAVYWLDMMQIQRLLTVARDDPHVRARMKRDLPGVLREWRLRLSEGAQAWLESVDIDAAVAEGHPWGGPEPLH